MTEAGKRLARAVAFGQRMNDIQHHLRKLTEEVSALSLESRQELIAAKHAVIDEESRPSVSADRERTMA